MAYNSLTEILDYYGKKIETDTKKNLDNRGKQIPPGKNASSSLKQSIKYDVKIFGDVYTFTVALNPYWFWVDKGRKPGGSFGAIYSALKGPNGWIAQKGLINKRIEGAKAGKISKKALSELIVDKNKAMAYFIAKKIVREGFKGSNFWSDVVNEKLFSDMQKDISLFLKQEINLQVVDLAEEILKLK